MISPQGYANTIGGFMQASHCVLPYAARRSETMICRLPRRLIFVIALALMVGCAADAARSSTPDPFIAASDRCAPDLASAQPIEDFRACRAIGTYPSTCTANVEEQIFFGVAPGGVDDCKSLLAERDYFPAVVVGNDQEFLTIIQLVVEQLASERTSPTATYLELPIAARTELKRRQISTLVYYRLVPSTSIDEERFEVHFHLPDSGFLIGLDMLDEGAKPAWFRVEH